MTQKNKHGLARYAVMALIIFLIGFAILITASIFSSFANGLEPPATEAPTAISTQSSGADLNSIDSILNQAMAASIAFSAPQTMKLDETAVIELIIDASTSEEEIIQKIESEGKIQTGTLFVTPLTKVMLIAQDKQAFEIQPLHDSEIQPVAVHEGPTNWQWQITAQKGGAQVLTLVVYRLIQFQGNEYWRQVEAYRSDINVEVNFNQRVLALDWKWLGGLLITSIIVPLFIRWLDKRKPAASKKRR